MSADGSRVVTGSVDKTARVWDARTGQTLVELTGHTGAVNSVAISADGTRVVTGSDDKTARVWDARTGQTLAELKGHTDAVESVAMSADGSRVVTQDAAGSPFAWNSTGTQVPVIPDDAITVDDDQTPDGRFRFLLIGNRVLRIRTSLDEAERDRNYLLTRPDPDWHVRRQKQLKAEGNAYGAALQLSSEQRARGVLAFDDGDFDKAQAYFLRAALLKPLRPKTALYRPAAPRSVSFHPAGQAVRGKATEGLDFLLLLPQRDRIARM